MIRAGLSAATCSSPFDGVETGDDEPLHHRGQAPLLGLGHCVQAVRDLAIEAYFHADALGVRPFSAASHAITSLTACAGSSRLEATVTVPRQLRIASTGAPREPISRRNEKLLTGGKDWCLQF